jgi:plastocyanin
VKVTFTKAGTYTYFCPVHGPDMAGTVVVTPAVG